MTLLDNEVINTRVPKMNKCKLAANHMRPGLAMTAIAQHEQLEQMTTRNVHKS